MRNMPKTLLALIVALSFSASASLQANPPAFSIPYYAEAPAQQPLFSVYNQDLGPGLSGGSLYGFGIYGYADTADAIRGYSNHAAGVAGYSGDTTFGVGVYGYSSNVGVFGQSVGRGPSADGVQGHTNTTPENGSGVAGFNDGTGAGVLGLSSGGDGVHGISNGQDMSGVYAQHIGSGNGLYARSASGYAINADGPVTQSLNADGMIKALIGVRYDPQQDKYVIGRCFNSQRPAATASIPPCGFSLINPIAGWFVLDIGFDTRQRIFLVQPMGPNSGFDTSFTSGVTEGDSSAPNECVVNISYSNGGGLTNATFNLLIY